MTVGCRPLHGLVKFLSRFPRAYTAWLYAVARFAGSLVRQILRSTSLRGLLGRLSFGLGSLSLGRRFRHICVSPFSEGQKCGEVDVVAVVDVFDVVAVCF